MENANLANIVLYQNDCKGKSTLNLNISLAIITDGHNCSLDVSGRFADITVTDDVNQYFNRLSSLGLNKLSNKFI